MENLDFYTFMYMVIEPTQMSLRAFNDQYDRLIFRTWSWSRFLQGKCGKLSLLGFVKWWAFVRFLIFRLRWKRRELYRAADQRAKASECRKDAAAKTEELVLVNIRDGAND